MSDKADRWLNKWVTINGKKWKVYMIDKSFYYRLKDEDGAEFSASVSDYWLHRNEVENEKRNFFK